MRNAWRVFTRDFKRVARVPKAWIIIVGVIVTPSLYAWFNIAAFWDPYSNTENIAVAVVNLDEGATSEATGDINIGEELETQLRDNDDLGWQFLGEKEALESVRKGDTYAAIIIPAEFSEDFAGLADGKIERPTLQYYVNEKENAIAPKITDVGASTLDAQVNSAFISEVAKAVTEALKGAGEDLTDKLTSSQQGTSDALRETADKVDETRERIASLQGTMDGFSGKIATAQRTIDSIDATLGDLKSAVAQIQTLSVELQSEVVKFTDTVLNAYVTATGRIADASSKVNDTVVKLTTSVHQANGEVTTAIDTVEASVAAHGAVLRDLQSMLDDADPASDLANKLSKAIASVEASNAAHQDMLKSLKSLNGDLDSTMAATQATADSLNDAVQQAASSSAKTRDSLAQVVPDLNHAISLLGSSAEAFSATIDGQRTQLVQVSNLLDNFETQLGGTNDALAALDKNLAATQKSLETIRTDVLALSSADTWNKLQTLTGLNAERIAHFMASPVEVNEHVLFPVEAYGDAMAPLFMNLSLWIGAFVLMVIFRLEVDRDEVGDITVREAYVGRWLFLAVLSVLQAVLLCVGTLMLGVQTVNPVVFITTGVLIGLAYFSIIYALSVSFGYVGKGLCIILVIMQIPGAAGLYPIEMMPEFFKMLNPYLPFTYGIDAIRETVSGFYGGEYWRCMGILAIFFALAGVLGLVLRQYLGHFTLFFNRNIAATHLLVSEDVQVVGSRYRFGRVIQALSNQEGYRREVVPKALNFLRRYPMIVRVVISAGIAILVLLGFAAWLNHDNAATYLGLWVGVCLFIIASLIILEYLRQALRSASELGDMSEAELREKLILSAPMGAGWGGTLPDAEPTATAVLPKQDIAETTVADEAYPDGLAVLEAMLEREHERVEREREHDDHDRGERE